MASTTDSATVSITREEYERLQSDAARIPQLERDVAKLSDELALLIKRLFGRSSERIDPAQLALFADASVPSVTCAYRKLHPPGRASNLTDSTIGVGARRTVCGPRDARRAA